MAYPYDEDDRNPRVVPSTTQPEPKERLDWLDKPVPPSAFTKYWGDCGTKQLHGQELLTGR